MTAVHGTGYPLSLLQQWLAANADRLAGLTLPDLPAQRIVAASLLRSLWEELMDDLAFEATLHTAEESATPGRQSAWHPILASTKVDCGLMTVSPGWTVPLHDHPGATGLLFLLAGSLTVEQFDRLSADNSATENPVHLRLRQETTISPGEAVFHRAAEGNIHRLTAHGRPALTFSLHINSNRDSRRTWYLVRAESGCTGSDLIAQCWRETTLREPVP